MRVAGVCATWIVALLAFISAGTGLGGGRELFHIGAIFPTLSLDFGVSSSAAPFLFLLGLLGAAVGAWSLRRGNAADTLLIAGFGAAMLLVLLARDVAAFFASWEAMSLSSAFLVGRRCDQARVRRATLLYLITAQAGALCILAAFALAATCVGSTSFSEIARDSQSIPGGVRDASFILALIGFGSKAGLVPLHVWLPRAHPAAPANASALLSGMMLNVALYGILLVTFELLGPGSTAWGIALTMLGAASMMLGTLYAVVDRDIKRILAYSSIENIGIITTMLGIAQMARAQGNPAIESAALLAAFFHIVAHGLFKGLLFLGAGTIHETEHTVDLEHLGGLAPRLRWSTPSILIACAAISALPPSSGFVSEWLSFQTLFGVLHARMGGAASVCAVLSIAALALASGLAAACFVRVFGIAFLGTPRRMRHASTFPPAESLDASNAALAALALACILLGVAPMCLLTPLAIITTRLTGAEALAFPTLPNLSIALMMLPMLGALLAACLNTMRGVRSVPTWTCGSPVTPAHQYTATAFSKPLRTIFAWMLRSEGRRSFIDESARQLMAMLFRFARAARALQSGSLRLYLLYITAAAVAVVLVAQ